MNRMSQIGYAVFLSGELMMRLLSFVFSFHLGEVEGVVQGWMGNLLSLWLWRRNHLVYFLNLEFIDSWLRLLVTLFNVKVVHVVLVF